METKTLAKPVRAIVSLISALLLIAVNLPITVAASVDDFFEDGNLIYIVTAEGSGGTAGTVKAVFNENLDPETITEIMVPGTVTHDGKSYSVTALTDSAFGSCTALTSLDMSECTGLVSIGMSAFSDCEKLSSITIPCNFNKSLFRDTGIVTDGDRFRIEYVVLGNGGEGGGGSDVTETPGGTFTYVHSWGIDGSNFAQHKCSRCNATEMHDFKVNNKNYSEHICTKCSVKQKHTWQLDANNSKQHKCAECLYAEAHYGGTAACGGKAKCTACGGEYQTAANGGHQWEVIPSTIGDVSAEYKCETCKQTEEQGINTGDSSAGYNGQKLKTILQDPYKVLPDGTKIKSTSVESGCARYNELRDQLDDNHKIENLAFFEIELYNSQGENISGEIAGKVRVLIQIPDGWNKEDVEAVLIMKGADVNFEESVITIDGTDYLAFWTNHFSPYALIEGATEKAEAEFIASVNGISKTDKLTVKWSKLKGAERYAIYAAYCCKKNKYKKIATVKGDITKYNITKLNGKKINPKKNVKFYIVAQKKQNGKWKKIFKTPSFHIAGAKSKYSNVKKITVKKAKFSLKKGKTAKINAKIILADKNKKAIAHVKKFRYKSTNTAVVKVDENGKIKAIGKGTATVYAYSNNGSAKAIRITVK